MNLQTIVDLELAFKDVTFFDKGHSYKIGDEEGTSVSRIIKKYEPYFDADKLANIVAKRQGVLVEDVRHLWDFKREYACEKGTMVHNYIENYIFRKRTLLNKEGIRSFIKRYPENITEETFYNDTACHIKNFLEFYKWWSEDHILVKSEYVMGDKPSRICGTLDNLSYNFKEKCFVIFDYKTNKALTEKKSSDSMLGILKHLQSSHIVKYSLQLHLYSLLIERNTGLKINNCNIVWIGGSDYELIPTMDLRTEAESIINNHTMGIN